MANAIAVQTAVCKSLQSIGLNPRKEHQIENAVASQIQSSGPEFLLARLSNLSDWRKMHMRGDTSYHPEWHAYKKTHRGCTPADPIGSNLWSLTDKGFFACLGALRKSVQLAIPSEKQLTKWLEGVRCPNTSDPEFDIKVRLNEKQLQRLERSIERQWTDRPWFNVSDISGTNIPGSGKFMKVHFYDKERKKEKRALDLVSAFGFSLSTAPLFTWQFLKDIDAPRLMSKGADDPDGLNQSLSDFINRMSSNPRLEDEAIEGSSFFDDENWLASREFINSRLGFMHTVGNIGFLQQPGGKLRTVANPNRFVQYVNRPLGEAMSELYSADGCFVLNQEAGMKWAQSKLRQGVSLSSFDMSSATDRLDYKKFLHTFFSRAYEVPDQYPLLSRSLELFEDTSECNWSIPGHISDLCNIPGNEVGWTVGQPLGLRPSFPTLTLMNMSFAMYAVRAVDGRYTKGHFACVGDDLVIESQYADAYMDAVSRYNGKINNDKTMVSSRYAEFCSHMITRSTIYPLKPRFILDEEGDFLNVEKFTTSGLRPKAPNWCVKMHNQIARCYLDGFTSIPFKQTANPAPLMERVGINTLIEVINSAARDNEHVSLQTLYLRSEQERASKDLVPKAQILGTSYAQAYPKFGGTKAQPKVKDEYKDIPISEYDYLGAVSTDRSTSVDLPVKKQWDFKKKSYQTEKQSPNTVAKRLGKKLSKVNTTVVDSLVESSIEVKGVKTDILVDTSLSSPEITVRYSKQSNGHSTVSRSKRVRDAEAQLQGVLDSIRSDNQYYDRELE